jgi:para-nitrobenzyl esterase
MSVPEDLVDCPAGPVRGLAIPDSAVRAFLGIPYAMPPVGERRWQQSEPIARWSEPHDATKFGAACPQPVLPADALLGQSFQTDMPLTMSEDCLNLNIWSSAKAGAQAPVLVWIHGGGNRFGSGASVRINGESLARRGLVVVTFNYRLNSLGFLAHPELTQEGRGSSGNYGLGDILQALKWVRINISAFGGNPNNITLGGQSAGATHVITLMASPLGKGLFQRAISQSPTVAFTGATRMPTLAAAESQGLSFAKSLGSMPIAALRLVPAHELVSQPGFGPCVDGRMLPSPVDAIFLGKQQSAVPLIVGSNSDEGSAYPQPDTKAELIAKAEQMYRVSGDEFVLHYPVLDDSNARHSATESTTDALFGWQSWTLARLHAAAGNAVFAYHFSQVPTHTPGKLFRELGPAANHGAFHGSEVPFMFDNLHRLSSPWTASEVSLAAEMAAAWARFADTGAPYGAASSSAWPKVESAVGPVRYFGDGNKVDAWPRLEKLMFMDKGFAAKQTT